MATVASPAPAPRFALVAVMVQLALVAYLVYFFRLESPAFANRVFPLLAAGFVIHHFAPARFRLWLFTALSLASLFLVFGPWAQWIVAGVGAIIAAAYLPVAFRWRLMLVLLIGAGLAVMRLGIVAAPWAGAVWPILASMLMFRVIVFLYDLSHQPKPPGVGFTLAYFFMLPNVSFTLFPLVDFATLKRTYYDREPTTIYAVGIQWILRGVFQLLLYRVVYHYASIAASEVVSSGTLVRYLLANFGLYLHVSGSFHLIVGILHLFGFRLPETHRMFYLSSSFTEFWRRINIYWKDFMQKVVFAPLFYPLRKKVGDTHALTLATLGVFAATWTLHGYQWFWILGRWEWSTTDALFWGALGLILVVNSHREARRGRIRSLTPATATHKTPRQLLAVGLGTAATFAVICVLWGLWTQPTVRDFLALFSVVRASPSDLLVLLMAPVCIGAIAVAVDLWMPAYARVLGSRPYLHFGVALAPVAVLAVVGQPRVAATMGGDAHRFALAVRSNSLNRSDGAALQRGYYEELTQLDRFNGALNNVYSQRPADWVTFSRNGGMRDVHSFFLREAVPNTDMRFRDLHITTNQYGMRDREYPLAKAAGTWRIAVVGRSHIVGEGVTDDSTFEAVLERALNEHRPADAPRIEILNCSVSGYTPLQQALLMDGPLVRQFAPDVVLYTGNTTDLNVVEHLAKVLDAGIELPYDTLRAIVARSGSGGPLARTQRQRLLAPHNGELLQWANRHVVEAARGMGAQPAWVYIPMPLEQTGGIPEVTETARAAGFTMLDVPDMFIGYDENDLQVALWDNHPNARGHAIIARRLTDVLLQHPALLGRSPGSGPQ